VSDHCANSSITSGHDRNPNALGASAASISSTTPERVVVALRVSTSTAPLSPGVRATNPASESSDSRA
jgi:hypothetical protein